MDRLGVSKQRLSDIARQQGWPYLSGYPAAPVEEYLLQRSRMELARKIGWPVTGLVEADDYDDQCPECEAFCLIYPDSPTALTGQYACVNGHQGQITIE